MRHSNSGYIALYDKDGEIIRLNRYKHLAQRRQVLEGWRKLYGQRFKELSYGITPDLSAAKLSKITLNKLIQNELKAA
jgi:hypothetical protein